MSVLAVMKELISAEQFREGFSRKQIAEKMDITSTALVKRVKAAGMLPYIRSARHIEAVLALAFEKDK